MDHHLISALLKGPAVEYKIRPIGVIRTEFKTKEQCPIQGKTQPDNKGQIVVFDEYADGLQDIELFSHITLLYHFDKAGEIKLVRPTFLDDACHGVFSSRHPCRPNGIGLTTVKLIARNGNVLQVTGVDMLDETPLIDIKPYMPRFDRFSDANNGWAENKKMRPKPADRE
ncbi:MAG: tRNA (N6-threonylcarbamoyladenosine(37)-N6)-methyltransferase TrmO [Sedimentisphaerales bacterium]|nr:tRNA (N6-threonylcarbamoyladenosine(37)-N6)-methyltransferase TrmO [Sedimentisphaerales bacterium]